MPSYEWNYVTDEINISTSSCTTLNSQWNTSIASSTWNGLVYSTLDYQQKQKIKYNPNSNIVI